jgi:hypothetical protein
LSDDIGTGAHRVLSGRFPQGWLARAGLLLLAGSVAILAFFFIVAFLLVALVATACLLVRWRWLARKVGRAQSGDSIEGEYKVVDSEHRDALPASPAVNALANPPNEREP